MNDGAWPHSSDVAAGISQATNAIVVQGLTLWYDAHGQLAGVQWWDSDFDTYMSVNILGELWIWIRDCRRDDPVFTWVPYVTFYRLMNSRGDIPAPPPGPPPPWP